MRTRSLQADDWFCFPVQMEVYPAMSIRAIRCATAVLAGGRGSRSLLLTPAFVWSPRLRGARAETGHDWVVVRRLLYLQR